MLGHNYKQLHVQNISTDECTRGLITAHRTPACYLVKGEGPDGVGGQLHRVQQSDLDQAVGLCAAGRPVLIALHLRGGEAGKDAQQFA